jgi:hypothetical protein
MTTLHRSLGAAMLVLAGTAPALAQQQTAAGRIKIVSGDAFILRGSRTLEARPGQVIFEADSLRTGADGSVGVTLKDDTRLSLGPNSEVKVERFVFAPGAGRLGMVLKFMRGVAAYVSGKMAKLAPDAVRLETPAAIVGVRGTTVGIRIE